VTKAEKVMNENWTEVFQAESAGECKHVCNLLKKDHIKFHAELNVIYVDAKDYIAARAACPDLATRRKANFWR
jgi:hypothetical protein